MLSGASPQIEHHGLAALDTQSSATRYPVKQGAARHLPNAKPRLLAKESCWSQQLCSPVNSRHGETLDDLADGVCSLDSNESLFQPCVEIAEVVRVEA